MTAQTPGEKLRAIREEQLPKKAWTQRATAVFLGVNEETYRSYEYDKAALPEALAKRLAEAWSIAWRVFYEDVPLPGAITRPASTVSLPYWGTVPAGQWEEPVDDVQSIEVNAIFAAPKGKKRVVLLVRGNSLEPLVKSGEYVIVELEREPATGLAVVARNGEKQITAKVLVYASDGFHLQSANPANGDAVAPFIEQVGIIVGRERKGAPDDYAVEYVATGLKA